MNSYIVTVAPLKILDISLKELLCVVGRHIWSVKQRGRRGNVICEYRRKENYFLFINAQLKI